MGSACNQSRWVVLALLLSFTTVASAELLFGRVVGVADGDTITLLDSQNQQHNIRLSGIDAPERAQPFGQRSKQSLSNLVYGKTVTVEVVKRDKYRRSVGKVLIDGSDANLEQIRQGLAWNYKAYEREQSPKVRGAYARAEIEAQEGPRGLWIDRLPKPPWEWRRSGR